MILLSKIRSWRKRKRALKAFVQDFDQFRALAAQVDGRFSISEKDLYPCLGDKTATTPFDRHYIYHTAWGARVLAETRPAYHVDISSSLHFSTIVSAFLPIHFYDYRPAEIVLNGFTSGRADLAALPFDDESVPSLSCMHVIEHIGLGRYGDSLDPNGDLRAIAELKRVLARQGLLLFVVPIGTPRIQFNAHRIYSYDQVVEYFSDLMLREFALIPDSPSDGGLVVDNARELADRQRYGCGCFWFVKE